MDRDDAVALISQRLGNRGTSLNTQIVLELQQAQRVYELWPELPWFLSVKNTDLSTSIGDNTVTLPSTFIMVDEDKAFFITDTEGDQRRLTKNEHSEATGVDWLGRADATIPEQYDIQAFELYLYPKPDAVYALELNYFAQDASLSSGSIENEWLKYAPDVLISEAGLQIARFNQFEIAMQAFTQDRTTAVARMQRQTVARRESDRNALMGG